MCKNIMHPMHLVFIVCLPHCLVLSWRILGRPPHGVSCQWAVLVRYGMRQALACQADFWRQLGSPDFGLPCYLHEINDVEPQLCCQNDQKVTKISNFVTVLGRATCRTRMRTTTHRGSGGLSPSEAVVFCPSLVFCKLLITQKVWLNGMES